MLQLRQCKLAFPSVHLLVGVCSSSLVREHKSNPVFSSSERYESVRHVKWCDEVVEDAPWTIDQAFIDKWQIDYVAHDEEPYASAGKEDVYAYAKSIGACTFSLPSSASSLSPPLSCSCQPSLTFLPPAQVLSSRQNARTVSPPPSFSSAVRLLSPSLSSFFPLTPHPSTVVEGYREGSYDSKLLKLGHPELCSRQGSEVGTQAGSVRRDI
jgi:glycerol-3-phosphate cytidylyltransferase-like family protein